MCLCAHYSTPFTSSFTDGATLGLYGLMQSLGNYFSHQIFGSKKSSLLEFTFYVFIFLGYEMSK